MAPKKPARKPMTDDHKEKLAQGRHDSVAVKAYLTALREHRPKRGARRDLNKLRARLEELPAAIAGTDEPFARLHLLQEQADIERALVAESGDVDMDALVDRFVDVAARYAQSKGIERNTWRKVGVPADVLDRAGIK